MEDYTIDYNIWSSTLLFPKKRDDLGWSQMTKIEKQNTFLYNKRFPIIK